MAFTLQFGQYYQADSPVHKLDARVKLVQFIALVVFCFFIATPAQLIFACVAILALTRAAKIPLNKLLQTLKPLVLMLAFLSLFNLFLVGGTPVLWQAGPLTITAPSLWAAVLYSVRVLLALVVCLVLLFSTTPTQLADGFESLLSPLARFGFPARQLAMVFSLMLRFIPTLAEELSSIMDAQRSRGARLGEGSLAKRIKSLLPVMVALLASALHHASNLARALDARGYRAGATRTHWHTQHLGTRELLSTVFVAAYFVILIGVL